MCLSPPFWHDSFNNPTKSWNQGLKFMALCRSHLSHILQISNQCLFYYVRVKLLNWLLMSWFPQTGKAHLQIPLWKHKTEMLFRLSLCCSPFSDRKQNILLFWHIIYNVSMFWLANWNLLHLMKSVWQRHML